MKHVSHYWTDIRERVASGKVSKRAILHDLHAHYDQQYGLAWENLAEKIRDSGLGRDIKKRELERFINQDVVVVEAREQVLGEVELG